MNDPDNLPCAAAALPPARACPLDETEPESKQPKWNDTPHQSSIENPNGPNPAPLLAQRGDDAGGTGDPMPTTRPANPRQCLLIGRLA